MAWIHFLQWFLKIVELQGLPNISNLSTRDNSYNEVLQILKNKTSLLFKLLLLENYTKFNRPPISKNTHQPRKRAISFICRSVRYYAQQVTLNRFGFNKLSLPTPPFQYRYTTVWPGIIMAELCNSASWYYIILIRITIICFQTLQHKVLKVGVEHNRNGGGRNWVWEWTGIALG